LFAFRHPRFDDVGSELLVEDLLLAAFGPFRSSADDTDVGSKEGLLFLFSVGGGDGVVGSSGVHVVHVDRSVSSSSSSSQLTGSSVRIGLIASPMAWTICVESEMREKGICVKLT
jgi:hypothetical protein